MFGIENLLLFVLSCILLNLTPGQDTLYIVSRSVAQGRRAGIYSGMGIMTGVLVHTLMAAFGMSAILASSTWAFQVVKYIGATYLVYLGVRLIFSNKEANPDQSANHGRPAMAHLFRQGMLTNLTNPKVALFFLSFLPQFVDPNTPYHFLPFVLLGGIFFITGGIWCFVLAWSASSISGRFTRSRSVAMRLEKLMGGVFIGLGLRLALERQG